MLKVIIDFDGTLTAEETQAELLAEKWLDTLAAETLRIPHRRLVQEFESTKARLLGAPHAYGWEVNGLLASYCDEGPFILSTTTLHIVLRENIAYTCAVRAALPESKLDPVVDYTALLFHRHTAELPSAFRPAAQSVLTSLIRHPDRIPLVLTNSMGDKVRRQLALLGLGTGVAVVGNTRQYEIDPNWPYRFPHADLGDVQVWPLSDKRFIDLRRPVYHRALVQASSDGSKLAVVADTLSLPGALPLFMDIPFFLLHTSYTPAWCIEAVNAHPLGHILEELGELPAALDALSLE